MRSAQAYIREIRVGPVPEAQWRSLAQVLAGRPCEVVLTSRGAMLPGRQVGPHWQRVAQTQAAATALARRNVRSLISRNPTFDSIIRALQTAVTAPPAEAEDALEDAGLDFNLRYSLFAASDAALCYQGHRLMIGEPAEASAVTLARQQLRDQGTDYFCKEALARLVSLDVTEIVLDPQAVLPLAMQVEPGAIMQPDTAHHHLHKGQWRGVRKPDFIKAFCVACGRCFVHCPDNAIIHAMFNADAQETTGILGIDTDRCTACGLCATVCPANHDGHKAIVMIAADSESSPELHCVG